MPVTAKGCHSSGRNCISRPALKDRPTQQKCVTTKRVSSSRGCSSFIPKTGQRGGRKIERSKPGYELYSSGSEDTTTENLLHRTLKQEALWSLAGTFTSVKSLDQANSGSRAAGGEESRDRDAAMSYVVQRHSEHVPATAFNKRLVSSTPDPERLMTDFDDEDAQMIPEHDLGPGRVPEDGAAELLSEAERLRLRQQLDAHLIEEALAKNKDFQEKVRELTAAQRQQVKADKPYSQAPSFMTLSQGIVTEAKCMVPVTIPVVQNVPAAGFQPQYAAQDAGGSKPESHLSSNRSVCAPTPKAVSHGPCTFPVDPLSSPRAPLGTTWASWGTALKQHQESDISDSQSRKEGNVGGLKNAYQEAVSQPMGLKRQKDGGDDGHTQPFTTVPPNLSMGFSPAKSKSSGSCAYSRSEAILQPLTVSVEGHHGQEDETGDHREPVHLATPACSPVRSSSQAAKTEDVPLKAPVKPARLATAARLLTQKAAKSPNKSGKCATKSSTVSVNKSVPKSQKPSNKPQKTSSIEDGCFTADGYYINHTVGSGKENTDESTPRPSCYTPAPYQQQSSPLSPMPESDGSPSCRPAVLDQNNSSTHLNTNQNMNSSGSSESLSSPRYQSPALYGGREAMLAEERDQYKKMELDELQMVYSNPEVEQGPKSVRRLLAQLKQAVSVRGDLEACRLVQQLQVLVETMPQLKIGFNLLVEIGLHQLPLNCQITQLNRRIRILNMQLKERERVEKEGLHPSVQAEMLMLQSESMELHQRVVEMEKKCQELGVRNSKLEEEVKQLKTQAVQKERESTLARQEMLQQLSSKTQMLDSMALRGRSLQEQLTASDNQNRILELNMRQHRLELHQLQDTLGNYKQAVSELLDHCQHPEANTNFSNANIRSLPSFRVLNNWLKSSGPRWSADCSRLSSSNKDPLDRSGNQRSTRQPRADGKENAIVPSVSRSPNRPARKDLRPNNVDSQVYDFFMKPRSPQSKDQALSQGVGNASEYTLLKETLSSSGMSSLGNLELRFDSFSKEPLVTHKISPSPLTVEAVAVHNQLQESMQGKGEPLSHSWAGKDCEQSRLGKKAPPYHSDPEISALESKRSEKSGSHCKPLSRIHQWKVGVEEYSSSLEEGSLTASSNQDGVGNRDRNSKRKMDSEPENSLTVPTLSEFPISDGGESFQHKAEKPNNASRNSVTDYFKKYAVSVPASTNSTEKVCSEPTTSSSGAGQIAVVPSASLRGASASLSDRSPRVSSPNSSLSVTASDTTQRDHFQGTQLDLSLSTIAEDASSTVTGLTGVSISSAAISRDDRKFREGVSVLDDRIIKVQESLNKLRKDFS